MKGSKKWDDTWDENCPWNSYCELGFTGCLSQSCGCSNTFRSRYMNARARGLGKLRAWLYAIRRHTNG